MRNQNAWGRQAKGRNSKGRSSKSTPELCFAGEFEYWLTRKSVKNINMHIKPPDGLIVVSAPFKASKSEIDELILSKRCWIRDAQEQIASSPSAQAHNASEEEKASWRDIVAQCTPALIAAWEPILGVKAGKVVYRNMKSRWGSCQPSTGRICINTRLALYPPYCLEYVVVHELCHLLVRGHGPDFHKLLDSVMPDWRERRAVLR